MAINITSRIRNAMVALSLTLCLLFTALIFLFAYVIEDRIFVNQIKLAQADFAQAVASESPSSVATWQPRNADIRRVVSVKELPDSVPPSLRQSIENKPGVYEYFDEQHALFIAPLQLTPEGSVAGLLVYDVSEVLAVRDSKTSLFVIIGLISLCIAMVAVWVARRLTKTTLAPVRQLTSALKANDLDDVIIDLARSFSEDEISVLTQELARSLEQAKQSAQREYEFNRGVSHELRSPIQVALSSVELLQALPADVDAANSKPVARLERSVNEMSEIAEAFLWLASHKTFESSQGCPLSQLKQLLMRVQQASVNVRLEITDSVSDNSVNDHRYAAPYSVLAVILRNLIRNAAIHGADGKLLIELNADSILISNTANDESRSADGFGVGLSIVSGLCSRFSIALEHGLVGTHYQAGLRFCVSTN